MSARRQTARTSTNHIRLAGKSFYLTDSYRLGGGKEGMRAAAKRFVLTPDFNKEATYYEVRKIDGRYQFTPMLPMLPLSAREI